jgi:hypothetical protein
MILFDDVVEACDLVHRDRYGAIGVIASIAALLVHLFSISALSGFPFALVGSSKKRFGADMSRFAVSRKSMVLHCLSPMR